jgi:ABC-2 type transport system ATP-binding protein
MYCIEIENLSKKFKETTAVDNLTLKIEKGNVFGFLGPNGAGKTTTIKMILGLIKPTSGRISILGESLKDKNKYLSKIGYLPDVPNFYKWMTAKEFLQFSGELFHIESKELKLKIEELIELVGLKGVKQKIGGYSRGMKQRLGLAQALINSPEIVFLDEPTSALDPLGRKEVLDTILSFKEKVTVFFSTHILSDVERVCNRAVILNKGKLIVDDSIPNLRKKFGDTVLEMELTNTNEDLFNRIKSNPNIKNLEVNKNNIKMVLLNEELMYEEIPKILFFSKCGLISQKKSEPSLEDIFVKLVNKK